jgi:hypothetical protein
VYWVTVSSVPPSQHDEDLSPLFCRLASTKRIICEVNTVISKQRSVGIISSGFVERLSLNGGCEPGWVVDGPFANYQSSRLPFFLLQLHIAGALESSKIDCRGHKRGCPSDPGQRTCSRLALTE